MQRIEPNERDKAQDMAVDTEATLLREQGVGGSNPLAPTNPPNDLAKATVADAPETAPERQVLASAQRLYAASRALVDAVDFDNNGKMIGDVFRGGNGGLLSLATIRAADNCRKALNAYQRAGGS